MSRQINSVPELARRLDLTLKQWKVNGYHAGYNVEVEEAARDLLDALDTAAEMKKAAK